MTWFFIAILAYFLFAVVNLTDKFIIDNVVKSSKTYVFLVCSLGALIFLASPWLLHYPGHLLLLFNLATGILFAVALFFLYESLSRNEASRTIILIGGSIPIFSSFLSWMFLGDIFIKEQIFGLIFLLIGIFLIAFLPKYHSFWENIWMNLKIGKHKKNSYLLIILSAFFYALFFVASKYTYEQQSFWSAFIWVRLGAFLAVLFFLIDKKSRKEIILSIKGDKKKNKKKNKNIFLFLFNQGLGSSAFILQNYAIFLGPVALINALQGFQYGVMIMLSFFLGFFHKEYKEKFSYKKLIQQIIALSFISLGLYLIAIYS